MSMGNNKVLDALFYTERLMKLIDVNSRNQINRTTMDSINGVAAQVLSTYIEHGIRNNQILGPLRNILVITRELLDDSRFAGSDSETKRKLHENLEVCLSAAYITVAKYYEEHDFDYTPRIDFRLRDLVDVCVSGGYYFGVDMDIQKDILNSEPQMTSTEKIAQRLQEQGILTHS